MKGGALVLAVVAVGFAVARFVGLDADPWQFVDSSHLSDEGWYSESARNFALFGQSVLDEHNVALVLCPLHNAVLSISYAIFGVSFWSTRLPTALASLVTLGWVAWRLRPVTGTAVFAVALLACQPLLFAYARVAFVETLQLTFLTATWAFASSARPSRVLKFAAGAAAAAALLAKPTALYAPVLAVVGVALAAPSRSARERLSDLLWVVVGGLSVALVALPHELRHLDLLLTEASRESAPLPASVTPGGIWILLSIGMNLIDGQVPVNLPSFSVGLLPTAILLGLAAGLAVSRGASQGGIDPERRAALRTAWLWLGLAVVNLTLRRDVPPERYWVALLVPMTILSAIYLAHASRGGASRRSLSGARRWFASALFALGPLLVLRPAIFRLIEPIWSQAHSNKAQFLAALFGVGLALCVLATLAAWARLPDRVTALFEGHASSATFVVGLTIAICGALVFANFAHSTYTLRDVSRRLVVEGETRVLVGDQANTLALETPYFAFVRRDLQTMGMGTGWVNEDWRKLGATHWLRVTFPDSPAPLIPAPEFVEIETQDLCPDRTGRPRLVLHTYERRDLPAESSNP